MTDKEIVDYLRKKEEMYPVNEWVIQGRHIWPLVKMSICSYFYRNSEAKVEEDTSYLKKVLVKVRQYRNLFSKFSLSYDKADLMIFHHNVSRYLILDDKSEFDVNLDPFTLMLEDKYNIYSLEYMAGSNHANFFRSSTVVDGVIQRAILCSKFVRSVDEKRVSLAGFDQFLDECDSGLKEKISVMNIYRTIYFMNIIASFFSNVIKKKKIKLVIAGCGYGIDTAALFMACKDVGIKCIEVQHGVAAGNGHCWYASWGKMPKCGTRYGMLPDIYWCWSNDDQIVLDSWATGLHVVYMGEKPIYSVIDELDIMTRNNSFLPMNKLPNILLTLQPGVSYPDWLVEVINETCNEYNWVVRKHPRFDECQSKFIDSISSYPNVYVDGVETILLEKLLIKSALHVTNHSTVALDALNFNLKSIIIDEKYLFLFHKQIEEKNIFLGNCKDVFMFWLRNHIISDVLAKQVDTRLKQRNMCFLSRQIV